MATHTHHLVARGALCALLLLAVVVASSTAPTAAAEPFRGAQPAQPRPSCFSPVAGLRELSTTARLAGGTARSRPAYGWPVRPFGRQHPVRAHFNDPREGSGDVRQFHFGIDISAPDGTPVYAVAPGTVYLANANAVAVRAPDRRRVFAYWHIVPVVRDYQYVNKHQLLGHIEAPWAHVHFAESLDGSYLNPLRPGALGPYADTTAPTIADVRFARDGRPLAFSRVGGRVDVVADVYDTTPLAVAPPWARMPVTPASLRWRVLDARGAVAVAWRDGPHLGGRLHRTEEFWSVYTRRTKQNHPHQAGRYCIFLARGWHAAALAPGRYTIEVEAGDLGGNRRRASLPFMVS